MSSIPNLSGGTANNKTLELLIAKAFLEAEKTCSSPWVLVFANILPGTSITFHDLLRIIGGVLCLINCIIALYLIYGHIVHWVRPDEQRQILRIILFVVVFSLCGFFSIYFYAAQPYIHPFAVYYEGFAMTAIFLLFVQLVSPNTNNRRHYFANLERRWFNGKPKGTKGSLRWYRILHICVFQITFTRIGTFAAQEVLFGNTCPLSSTRRYGSTIIQVIQGLSTTITVAAVVMFERRMHAELQNHRAFLKLVSFKGIVGLEATQDILFAALADTGIYFPSSPYHVSWADFAIGIPEFILVIEMTIVAVMFLWSFTFKPYKKLAQDGEKIQAPSWKALLSTFNLSDIWRNVLYMFTCFTKSTYLEGDEHGDGSDASHHDAKQVTKPYNDVSSA